MIFRIACLVCVFVSTCGWFGESRAHVAEVGSEGLIGHWRGSISREGKTWTVWLDSSIKNGKQEATVNFPDFGLYALSGNLVTEASTINITTIAGNALATFDGKL